MKRLKELAFMACMIGFYLSPTMGLLRFFGADRFKEQLRYFHYQPLFSVPKELHTNIMYQ